MRQGCSHAGEIGMSDDELRRLRAKSIVKRDSVERLGHSSQVDNLPFWSVLTPQANAIVCAGDAFS